jgi:hypothetical protein
MYCRYKKSAIPKWIDGDHANKSFPTIPRLVEHHPEKDVFSFATPLNPRLRIFPPLFPFHLYLLCLCLFSAMPPASRALYMRSRCINIIYATMLMRLSDIPLTLGKIPILRVGISRQGGWPMQAQYCLLGTRRVWRRCRVELDEWWGNFKRIYAIHATNIQPDWAFVEFVNPAVKLPDIQASYLLGLIMGSMQRKCIAAVRERASLASVRSFSTHCFHNEKSYSLRVLNL